MAKYRRTEKQLTRRQVARREKEYRAQRLITLIAAGLGVLIVGILIYGIVTELFIKAQRPVAQVGDAVITTQDYRARQNYERWMTQLQVYQYQSYLAQLGGQQTTVIAPEEGEEDPNASMDSLVQQLQLQLTSLERQLSPDLASVFGGQVLDRMIEEALVRQEAAERGLTVSEDRMQEEIGVLLGYSPTATDTLTGTNAVTETVVPTAEAEDFDDLYAQFKTNVLQASRFAEKDFRDMVRASLLRDQLRVELSQDVDLEQEQVEIILFSLETEVGAGLVRDQLIEDNEDPVVLAEEFGLDDDPNTLAYSLPWMPIGYLGSQLGIEVERAAFNTPVGETSEIVRGQDGRFYVVYVLGHEVRELTEEFVTQAEDQAYQTWLTQAKAEQAEYFNWQAAVVTN